MSDILCVTNRMLCTENFLERIEKIAKAKPAGIILREKDLSEEEYTALASKVLDICRRQGVRCILHGFVGVSAYLGAEAIHLPLPLLLRLNDADRAKFSFVGASCHSAEDAVIAQAHGCTYVSVGHIFETSCKKGLPSRGTEFLKSVCTAVSVPVYAIGGICPENMAKVRSAGAAGACVMSGIMTCKDTTAYLAAFEKRLTGG